MTHVVEKRPVPVRLSQPGQSPLDGELMLFPRVGSHERPETLLELLNGARQVIPFIQSEDGQVVLVVRANIGWVAVRREADPQLLFPPSYRVTHAQPVQLYFTDENRIEASIEWDQSNPHHRLSDHLNESIDFFPVRASFGLVFINRRRLRQLRIIKEAVRLDPEGTVGDVDGRQVA